MATIKTYQKQKEKEKIAYNYFTSQGYSPEASAGIVGNLVYESGLNTSAEGDIGFRGGSSFGIAQFRGKRLENLKKRYGDKWTDFGNQLDFVRHELETTHKRANNALKNANNVYDAGSAFSDLYEIPAKKYKDNKDRQTKVNNVYSTFTGNKINPNVNTQTPVANAVISGVNDYFQYNPTIDVKDLQNSEESVNFIPETEESEQEEVEDKDIAEIKQQTREYNFLQEYQNIVNQQANQVIPQEETVQEIPQQNFEDIYNQVSEFIDTPIAQQGTIVKDNIPTYKPRVNDVKYDTTRMDVTDDYLDVKNFTYEYINSPKYKERLVRAGYVNPEQVIKERGKNIQSVDVIEANNPKGTYSNFFTKQIILDREQDKKNGLWGMGKKDRGTIAHEIIHQETPFDEDLNNRDTKELLKRQKQFSKYSDKQINKIAENPEELKHDSQALENKADLNTIRFMLKEQGIYDTGKEDLTRDHLKKLKPSFVKDRLLKNYTEEDLIWLMNNIAQININDNASTRVAQQGGAVEASKEFLQNWYQNRVLPDSELNQTYQGEKQRYIQQSQNLPNPSYVDRIDKYNTQGTYDPQTKQIELISKADPLVYTHEASHAINLPLIDTESSTNASNIIGENITPREKISNKWVKTNYPEISDYQEVIPRLNSYRYYHALEPNQVITPELIKQNRESYNKGEIPVEINTDQLYKLFGDEELSNVLNKVVSTDGASSNYYAQQGMIIDDNQGQYNHPGSVTRINSPNITMKKVPYSVLGVADTGETIMMEPEKEYYFKGAKTVTEYPQLTKNEQDFLKHISKNK